MRLDYKKHMTDKNKYFKIIFKLYVTTIQRAHGLVQLHEILQNSAAVCKDLHKDIPEQVSKQTFNRWFPILNSVNLNSVKRNTRMYVTYFCSHYMKV